VGLIKRGEKIDFLKGLINNQIVRVISAMLAVLLLAYLVMFLDTNSLYREVRDVFLWKVDRAETEGRPINAYNMSYRFPDEELGGVNLELVRLFTLHNFKDGYIWALYSKEAYNKDGKIINGSIGIFTKWKIHKENGEWEIVEIFEAP